MTAKNSEFSDVNSGMWLETGLGASLAEGRGEEDGLGEPINASREYVIPFTCSTRLRSLTIPRLSTLPSAGETWADSE